MSDPVRVAFVVEGPTDVVVLRAAISALLGNREFVVTVLQPECSDTLAVLTGGGWTRVYRWCVQAADQVGGPVGGNSVFSIHDLLVLQVDADVAGKHYSDDSQTHGHPNDLPCEATCPPPSATTDRLRSVVLGWLGERDTPDRVVFCTPSKSLETWVLVALFPTDHVAQRHDVECWPTPERQLQSKPLERRLVRSGHKQIEKYKENEDGIRQSWPCIAARCSEAQRFSVEFANALSLL